MVLLRARSSFVSMRRLSCLVALLTWTPGARAAPNDPGVRIDPRADAQLRRMSDYLTSLRSFRVRALSSEDLVSTEGQKVQFLADQDIALERPNRLRVDRHDPRSDTVVRYDGRQLTIAGKRTGYYAKVQTPPDLTQAIDFVRDRYGVDAPAADLLVENPYDSLMEDVVTGRYLGVEVFNGVPLHHLAFSGKDVDWQIWIEDGPRPVPHRYAITAKHQKAEPDFTVTLIGWQPNANIPESEFAFTPPPGAQRIELRAADVRERKSL